MADTFTQPDTPVTGTAISADNFGVKVCNALKALWKGAAAGDVDYYDSANTKARLAATAGALLGWNAAGNALEAKYSPPICLLNKTDTWTVTKNTVAYVSFNSAGNTILDPLSWHSPTTNPTNITVNQSGIYEISAHIEAASGSPTTAGGGIWAFATINSGEDRYYLDEYCQAGTGSISYCRTGTIHISLTAGDYLRLYIQVTSTLGVDISVTNVEFSVKRIG